VRPLSPHAFNQRRDELFSRLDRLGRVDLRDLGANKGVRTIVADLLIPGQDGEPWLRDEVRFHYQRWWRASALG
jgi:hypothetical protein